MNLLEPARSKLLIRFLVYGIFFSLIAGFIQAQDKPAWQVNFENAADWYTLTSPGIFLVSTDHGLQGVDPETKEVRWKLPWLAGVPLENFNTLPNTPFFLVRNLVSAADEEERKAKTTLKGFGKGLLKGIKDDITKPYTEIVKGKELNRSVVLDPLQGKILFDSKDAGIEYVNDREFLPQIGCILFEGLNGKQRVFGLSDIINGKTLWVKQKPGKGGLLISDNLKPKIDPEGNMMFSSADSTFRINVRTGEYIWQKPSSSISYFVFNKSTDHFYAYGSGSIHKVDLKTGEIVKSFQPSSAQSKSNKSATPEDVLKDFALLQPNENELLASGSSSFNFFDYNTLTPKWPNASLFNPYYVKNASVQDNKNYLVNLKNGLTGTNAFSIVDSSGMATWSEPYAIKGDTMKFLEYTPYGIVFVTNEAADVVDLATGTSRLSNHLRFDKDQSFLFTYAKERNCLAFYMGNDLYELNYKAATLKKLLDKTGFKGDPADKTPNRLEARSEGYFLAAEQNMLLVGYDGTIKYQKYYNRPGMSDKAKLLLARFSGLAAGYVFRNQAQQLTTTMYKTGYTNSDDYFYTRYYDAALGGTGSAAQVSDLAVKAFGRSAQRAKIVQGNRNFQLVLAKLDGGGNGFIKVDKDTGHEIQSIRLDDKEPSILIDDALAGMYYLSPTRKQLSFFDLSKSPL